MHLPDHDDGTKSTLIYTEAPEAPLIAGVIRGLAGTLKMSASPTSILNSSSDENSLALLSYWRTLLRCPPLASFGGAFSLGP